MSVPHKDIVQAQTDALAVEQNIGALIWSEPDLGADRRIVTRRSELFPDSSDEVHVGLRQRS